MTMTRYSHKKLLKISFPFIPIIFWRAKSICFFLSCDWMIEKRTKPPTLIQQKLMIPIAQAITSNISNTFWMISSTLRIDILLNLDTMRSWIWYCRYRKFESILAFRTYDATLGKDGQSEWTSSKFYLGDVREKYTITFISSFFYT